MTLAPLALLIAGVVSLVLAIAVRHAGTARVLNLVDYTGVDAAALNAAVGRRLLVLPVACLALACLAWLVPAAGLAALCVALPVVLVTASWAVAARVR